MAKHPPVGVVGLGIMGSAIASHLIDAGHAVVGFDVRASRRRALRNAGVIAAATCRDGKTVYFTRIDNQVIAVDVARVGGDLRPGVARELFVAPGTFDHRSVLADTARTRFLVPVPHEQVTAGIDVVLNWQALLKGN